jgi:hypothetical protein
MSLSTAVEMGIYNAVKYYKKHDAFEDELYNYNRLNYGYDDIPKESLCVIAKREYIENLCKKLSITLSKADD